MKKIKPIVRLAFIFCAVMLSGCAASRKTVYFQNAVTTIPAPLTDAAQYAHRIMPNDQLKIIVSAPNPASVEVFNAQTMNKEGFDYLVDEQGYINGVPLIGRIRLGGLSREDACEAVRAEIAQQIDSPTVDIRVINFRVTVLGEVGSPGVYTAESGKLTLPEALGMAGDLTIHGKRNDVLLCRVAQEGKTFHRIDLTKTDLFFSSSYHLQQGDIIYVSPNNAKSTSAQLNPATPRALSIIGFLMGIAAWVVL